MLPLPVLVQTQVRADACLTGHVHLLLDHDLLDSAELLFRSRSLAEVNAKAEIRHQVSGRLSSAPLSRVSSLASSAVFASTMCQKRAPSAYFSCASRSSRSFCLTPCGAPMAGGNARNLSAVTLRPFGAVVSSCGTLAYRELSRNIRLSGF